MHSDQAMLQWKIHFYKSYVKILKVIGEIKGTRLEGRRQDGQRQINMTPKFFQINAPRSNGGKTNLINLYTNTQW